MGRKWGAKPSGKVDGLGFHVIIEPLNTALTSHARLLEPPEWMLGIDDHAVDGDATGLHSPSHRVAAVGREADRGYAVESMDVDAAAAGLVREHRFATWDLRPWHDGADFAVTVLRKPGETVEEEEPS